jgi:hypothetical protein
VVQGSTQQSSTLKHRVRVGLNTIWIPSRASGTRADERFQNYKFSTNIFPVTRIARPGFGWGVALASPGHPSLCGCQLQHHQDNPVKLGSVGILLLLPKGHRRQEFDRMTFGVVWPLKPYHIPISGVTR